MKMMKGQSTLELFVTIGVVLAFTVPVVFLLLSLTSVGYEDTAKAQAEASARSLADSINLVYTQGEGAQRDVLLNVPAATQAIYLKPNDANNGGEVIIQIKTSSGTFEAASPIIAPIGTGSKKIPDKSGLFKVHVSSKKDSTNHVVVELATE